MDANEDAAAMEGAQESGGVLVPQKLNAHTAPRLTKLAERAQAWEEAQANVNAAIQASEKGISLLAGYAGRGFYKGPAPTPVKLVSRLAPSTESVGSSVGAASRSNPALYDQTEVMLDANALTGMMERGEPVIAAMAGRRPVIPPQAAREYINGPPGQRTAAEIRDRAQKVWSFMNDYGGRLADPGSEASAVARQQQIIAYNAGRSKMLAPLLHSGDHLVLESMSVEQIPLLTRDRRLANAARFFYLIPGPETY